MNNNAPQGYQEISLIDLIWHICSCWRTLLVAMLVCALLAGGYQVHRNLAGNRAAESLANAPEQEGEGEEAFKALTPAEQAVVENALVYEQQLQMYLDYQENSIYINLDPYHENVQLVNYIVQVAKAASAEEENGEDEMSADVLTRLVEQSYVDYVNSGAAAGRLAEKYSDMEQTAIGELIQADEVTVVTDTTSHQKGSFTVNGATTTFQLESDSNKDKGYAIFRVRVIGRTKAETKELADALDKVLHEYFSEVAEDLGPHTLEQGSSTVSVIVDNSLVSARQGFQGTLMGARSNFNNTISAFTEGQKAAYRYLSGENKKMEKETDAPEEAAMQVVPLTSGLVKYMIFGLAGGLMLAAVVIAMIYVLIPTLKTNDDITRCFQYYLMADFSCYKETKKRFGAAVDRFLHRLRYRDQLPLEEEQRLLLTNMKVTCKKADISAVYLTSSCRLSEEESHIVQSLIADLESEGIKAAYGGSIERDAQSYERMTDMGAVVYVEKLGKSRFDSLENINAMTQKQGVKILGVIAM